MASATLPAVSHLDYAPIYANCDSLCVLAESEISGEHPDLASADSACSTGVPLAKLEILSALYDDVASHLVHHLDALHKIQLSSLKRVCHTLEDLEVEQGSLLALTPVACLALLELSAQGSRAARVVTNLKSFLASISSAFSAFLGFARAGSCANGASAPVPSSLPQSPTPSNLLFAISIPDGIACFDQDALSDRMRVEHEAEQSHLASDFTLVPL